MLLRGMIVVDGLCTTLEGSGEETIDGKLFIGVEANLGDGTQVLTYNMVADRTLRANGTINSNEKRGFYQRHVTWTPVDCGSVPSCEIDASGGVANSKDAMRRK
jgi:hypothetical protein